MPILTRELACKIDSLIIIYHSKSKASVSLNTLTSFIMAVIKPSTVSCKVSIKSLIKLDAVVATHSLNGYPSNFPHIQHFRSESL